jgi:hypothetical protein
MDPATMRGGADLAQKSWSRIHLTACDIRVRGRQGRPCQVPPVKLRSQGSGYAPERRLRTPPVGVHHVAWE